MSMRVVPSATLERICVSPRVNRAEPCTRGAMSISVSIGRISSWARPSGRFLSTAMRLRMVSFSSFAKAALTSASRSRSGCSSSVGGAYCSSTSSSTASIASWRSSLACDLRGLVELGAVRALDRLERRLVDLRRLDLDLLLAGLLAQLLPSCRTSFLISACAMSSASRISASVTPSAPASTIRIASSVPETIRSRSSSSWVSSSGLTTKSPSSFPIRTAPTCLATGISEIASAAEAPFIARMS